MLNFKQSFSVKLFHNFFHSFWIMIKIISMKKIFLSVLFSFFLSFSLFCLSFKKYRLLLKSLLFYNLIAFQKEDESGKNSIWDSNSCAISHAVFLYTLNPLELELTTVNVFESQNQRLSSLLLLKMRSIIKCFCFLGGFSKNYLP